MERQLLLKDTVEKLNQLPDIKIKEVNDFIEFLLSRIDDIILVNGIQEITSKSKSFEYLAKEEDLYTVNDLKKKYK
jgi:hypothetical protein